MTPDPAVTLDDLTRCDGIGRDVLVARIARLVDELRQARADRDEATARARTALLLEGCATCAGGRNYHLIYHLTT